MNRIILLLRAGTLVSTVCRALAEREKINAHIAVMERELPEFERDQSEICLMFQNAGNAAESFAKIAHSFQTQPVNRRKPNQPFYSKFHRRESRRDRKRR